MEKTKVIPNLSKAFQTYPVDPNGNSQSSQTLPESPKIVAKGGQGPAKREQSGPRVAKEAQCAQEVTKETPETPKVESEMMAKIQHTRATKTNHET